MYCPVCRADYREGFTKCSDCQVALVLSLPTDPPETPEPAPPPISDLDTVTVLTTTDPVALALAKGSLEDAGIPYYIAGELTGPGESISPLMNRWQRIAVSREDEEEARRLLEPLTEADGDDENAHRT
jgi:hypothetical protein